MTEYELADIIDAYASNSASSFAIFITVITAYLITAYGAGKQLQKSQLVILNLVYSLTAIVCAWASAGTLLSAAAYAKQLRELNPASPQSLNITLVLLILGTMLITFAASIKFMQDIRK